MMCDHDINQCVRAFWEVNEYKSGMIISALMPKAGAGMHEVLWKVSTKFRQIGALLLVMLSRQILLTIYSVHETNVSLDEFF
jgi:hypothetical protein